MLAHRIKNVVKFCRESHAREPYDLLQFGYGLLIELDVADHFPHYTQHEISLGVDQFTQEVCNG